MSTTTTEQNKVAIQSFFEAWNNRTPETFDEFVAPDVVRHCQATPDVDVHNLERLKEFFRQNTVIFPDSKQTLVRMVAEDNWVAVWGTYEGKIGRAHV